MQTSACAYVDDNVIVGLAEDTDGGECGHKVILAQLLLLGAVNLDTGRGQHKTGRTVKN